MAGIQSTSVATAARYEEDTPAASGDKGVLVLGVRNDAGGTLVDANGDYEPLQLQGGALVVSGGVAPSTTPVTYNVTMTLANTEYSQALPANATRFSLQCHTNFAIRFAYETGRVAAPIAPYSICKAGWNYYEQDIDATGRTLYFACANAAQVAEVIAWT